MGKTLRSPILRSFARRPPAAAPLDLKVYAKIDEGGLRHVLNGAYDMPGLSFASPPAILDIGANVGAATIWFSRRYPGCRIHAYEPSPENVAAFHANTLGIPNVTLHSVAVVGPEWGPTTTLFDGLHGPGQRSIYRLGEQRAAGSVVRTMRAAELPQADILKIDTEGCEREIIEHYMFLAGVKALMCEWHRPEDYRHLLAWLPERGLRLIKDVAQGRWIGERELFFVRD